MHNYLHYIHYTYRIQHNITAVPKAEKGKPYWPTYAKTDQSKSITESMPDPKMCTTAEWTKWFTGGDYKNIPKKSKLNLCFQILTLFDK
jgi:hypothetical protein